MIKFNCLQVALGRMESATGVKEASGSSVEDPAPKSDAEFQDFLNAFLQEVYKFEEACAKRRNLAVVLRPPRLNVNRARPVGRSDEDETRPRFSRARVGRKAVSSVASQTISA